MRGRRVDAQNNLTYISPNKTCTRRCRFCVTYGKRFAYAWLRAASRSAPKQRPRLGRVYAGIAQESRIHENGTYTEIRLVMR